MCCHRQNSPKSVKFKFYILIDCTSSAKLSFTIDPSKSASKIKAIEGLHKWDIQKLSALFACILRSVFAILLDHIAYIKVESNYRLQVLAILILVAFIWHCNC